MNGGSHPTERKALTGELTPPGIICSARFCNLREASTLRDMARFAARTNKYISQPSPCGCGRPARAELSNRPGLARPPKPRPLRNLPEIHLPATILQHAFDIFSTVTCSPNRESSGQSRGAPGCPFLFPLYFLFISSA